MKKLVTLLLCVLMVLSLIPAAFAQEDVTVLTCWIFNELHEQLYEAAEADWNALNPDRQIDIQITTYPYADMHTKLMLALQAGEGAPDLCDVEIGYYGSFMQGNIQFVPLDRVIEPELDNIMKSRVDIYSGPDGHYYGICFHGGASMAYYNMDLLNEAGIDPTAIVTFEDLREAAKVLKEKTGKPMLALEAGDVWVYRCMLGPTGGDFIAEDGSITFDTPENLQVFTYMQEMLAEGYAAVLPDEGADADSAKAFLNAGNVACLLYPSWYMGRFTAYCPDLEGKIQCAPLPVWEEGQPRSIGLGGTASVVTNQCQNQDLAVDFIGYMKLGEDSNWRIWELMGWDPIRTALWDEDRFLEPNDQVNFFCSDYGTPAEVLREIKDEVLGIHVSSNLPIATDILKTSLLARIIENMEDPATVLAEEQAAAF